MIYTTKKDGIQVSPITIGSDSFIAIRFDQIKGIPPYIDPEKRKSLIAKIIAQIGDVKYSDSIDYWPSFKISLLNSEDKRSIFKKIVKEIIDELSA